MSNYTVWDAGALTHRWLEWQRLADEAAEAGNLQKVRSLHGELRIIELELDARIFGKPSPLGCVEQ